MHQKYSHHDWIENLLFDPSRRAAWGEVAKVPMFLCFPHESEYDDLLVSVRKKEKETL